MTCAHKSIAIVIIYFALYWHLIRKSDFHENALSHSAQGNGDKLMQWLEQNFNFQEA
jgi:hypothetical protein